MRQQAKDGNIVFKDKSNYGLRVINETLKLPNAYIDSNKWYWRNVFSSLNIAIYLIYTNILIATLSLFSCRELEKGEYWLSQDLDVSCWGFTHNYYFYRFALPSFIIIIILYPIIIIAIILHYKRKKRNDKILLFFGLFVNGLKPKYFYYDMILQAKKITLIVFNIVLISESLVLRGIIFTFVIIFYNETLDSIKPYYSESIHKLEYMSNIILISMIYTGIFFEIDQSDKIYDILFFIASTIVITMNWYFILHWLMIYKRIHRRYIVHMIEKGLK